jgi:transposase-like protein
LERIPKQFYTDEFREEAVALVVDGGLTVAETSRRLSIYNRHCATGLRSFVTQERHPLADVRQRI